MPFAPPGALPNVNTCGVVRGRCEVRRAVSSRWVERAGNRLNCRGKRRNEIELQREGYDEVRTALGKVGPYIGCL